MKVKELIDILKDCSGDSEVKIIVEVGMGFIESKNFEVNVEIDENGYVVVVLSGSEDYVE